jgi:ketosteroid isomerase-like protein
VATSSPAPTSSRTAIEVLIRNVLVYPTTMKSPLPILCLLALGFALTPLATAQASQTLARSDSATITAAVIAADDERAAAMKEGDAGRLGAIFSDDLRYAHSSGAVDDKKSFMEKLVSHQSVYEKFDYKQRIVLPAGPGIALMSGRVLVDVRSGDQMQHIDLNYLSVWRQENGKWRFLAWQSCKNPEPAK